MKAESVDPHNAELQRLKLQLLDTQYAHADVERERNEWRARYEALIGRIVRRPVRR